MFKLLVAAMSIGLRKPALAKMLILGLIGGTFLAAMKVKARHTDFNLYRSRRRH